MEEGRGMKVLGKRDEGTGEEGRRCGGRGSLVRGKREFSTGEEGV